MSQPITAAVCARTLPAARSETKDAPLVDEVLDHLLDQEGLEVDPLDRMDGDTPLHKAVRFVNKLEKAEWHSGAQFVELLVDAGADPRYVNMNIQSARRYLFENTESATRAS